MILIDNDLRDALSETLQHAHRADFCVGYFNLRGWSSIDKRIEPWPGGEGNCCRLLVGMQNLPHEELRRARSLARVEDQLDNLAALRLKKRLAEEFREQLTFGAPSNREEAGRRRLSKQLNAGKVVVKLFLAHPLHAKLYLLHRTDSVNPIVGYLGSSNLTQAGLSRQGELNGNTRSDQRRPQLFGCTLFFPFRGLDMGANHIAIAIGQSENGLDKQKKPLAELLNQHPLYVNLSEIDEEGRALNRQFYGESSCK